VTWRTLPFELLGSGKCLSGNASSRRAALRIWRVLGHLVQFRDEKRTPSALMLMGLHARSAAGPGVLSTVPPLAATCLTIRAEPGREPNAFCPAFCRQPLEAQRDDRGVNANRPDARGRGVVLW